MRKALKGLEKCARKAVMSGTRRAKKLADLTNPDDPTPAIARPTAISGTASTLGSTAFGKKFTQSLLSSTAFPDSGIDIHGFDQDGAHSNTIHVHRNHRAVGIVFGLALVQRLFNRYSVDGEDSAPSIPLMVVPVR